MSLLIQSTKNTPWEYVASRKQSSWKGQEYKGSVRSRDGTVAALRHTYVIRVCLWKPFDFTINGGIRFGTWLVWMLNTHRPSHRLKGYWGRARQNWAHCHYIKNLCQVATGPSRDCATESRSDGNILEYLVEIRRMSSTLVNSLISANLAPSCYPSLTASSPNGESSTLTNFNRGSHICAPTNVYIICIEIIQHTRATYDSTLKFQARNFSNHGLSQRRHVCLSKRTRTMRVR